MRYARTPSRVARCRAVCFEGRHRDLVEDRLAGLRLELVHELEARRLMGDQRVSVRGADIALPDLCLTELIDPASSMGMK